MQQNAGNIYWVSPFLHWELVWSKNSGVCWRLFPTPHASSPMPGVRFEGLVLRKKRRLAGHCLHAGVEPCINSIWTCSNVWLTARTLQNRRTCVHSSSSRASAVILRHFSALVSLTPSSKMNSSIACANAQPVRGLQKGKYVHLPVVVTQHEWAWWR